MTRAFSYWLLFALVAILILCVGCQNGTEADQRVYEFDANDPYYQERMERYSISMQVGAVSDPDTARREAWKVFQLEFGAQSSDYGACVVSFDSNAEIWFVWVQPSSRESGGVVFGGSKCVLISTDGQVLALWEDK